MELKTIYAKRFKETTGKDKGLPVTLLYNEAKEIISCYGANIRQPHKNKKTIVHNCFTYKLVWL